MKSALNKKNYGEAILEGFEYLLEKYPEVFVIGQGLWSPWYVGNSMTNLDKRFGTERIIDTPVSESACTGAAVGASLDGMRPIVVHPRIDFMLYALDAIVNQAAKWSHMFGGQDHPSVTIRGIINRGGEQGAQHSQSLHSWFAHIPGLRVVMPSTPSDARDLLIASVLCDDPVVFIDDRWLYDQEEILEDIVEYDLRDIKPKLISSGDDLTIVSSSYSTRLCTQALIEIQNKNISAELFDLRVISPLNVDEIVNSVKKTGRLLVVDGGWGPCGLSSEIIASIVEKVSPDNLLKKPSRINLPFAPAPTSAKLEEDYYFNVHTIVNKIYSDII